MHTMKYYASNIVFSQTDFFEAQIWNKSCFKQNLNFFPKCQTIMSSKDLYFPTLSVQLMLFPFSVWIFNLLLPISCCIFYLRNCNPLFLYLRWLLYFKAKTPKALKQGTHIWVCRDNDNISGKAIFYPKNSLSHATTGTDRRL